MASSSCALQIRGASAAREFLPVVGKRGCHLMGSGSVKWQRRVRCGEAAVAISHEPPAAARSTSTRLVSFPYSEFAPLKRQPAMESAAEVCAKKMVMVEEERASVTPEKLDSWVRGSVGEIVRNIRNAPFLVQMFDGGRGGKTGEVRLETEAASPENWPRIKKRWGKARGTPDVVILVEELKEEETECDEGERTPAASVAACPEGPQTWGLAVQGRRMDCTAFYILDTTSVKSTVGLCTHFTLVRAKCFGEPVEVQLRNAWLQTRQCAMDDHRTDLQPSCLAG